MKTTTAVILADLDEMLFTGRERSYGAYYLRKSYQRHLTIALAISFFAFFAFTFSPVIANMLGPENNDLEVKKLAKEIILTNTVEIDRPEEIEQPARPPKLKKPITQTIFQIPEPSPDPVDKESTITEMDTLKEAKNISLEEVKGEDGFIEFFGEIGEGNGIPDIEIITEPDPDPDIFIFAEAEPEAINMADIVKEIGYPRVAQDAGLEGKVILRVLVDRKGKYQKHKLLNSTNPIFSNAVESQVNKLKFTPAIQGGNPIAFWVNIPFNFNLMGQ